MTATQKATMKRILRAEIREMEKNVKGSVHQERQVEYRRVLVRLKGELAAL